MIGNHNNCLDVEPLEVLELATSSSRVDVGLVQNKVPASAACPLKHLYRWKKEQLYELLKVVLAGVLFFKNCGPYCIRGPN